MSRKRRKGSALLAAAAFLVLLLNTGTVWAHKVNVYAYAEGETVHIRGYFRKTPAKNCKVVILAPDGSELLTGMTDGNGDFVFKAPFRMDLEIKLSAGEGHTSSYLLKAEELPASLPEFSGQAPLPIDDKKVEPVSSSLQTENARKDITVTEREIEQIVEKVVENKVAPLRKMMLEQQEKSQDATFEKVLAGVGIIFGLMGFTIYLRSVWKRKS